MTPEHHYSLANNKADILKKNIYYFLLNLKYVVIKSGYRKFYKSIT